MRPLSEATARVAGQNFSRKFVALGRIAAQWEAIIGAQLATKAQPAGLRYRKATKRGKKPQAILEIAASSADATLLHYQKDLILERLNQIFGDRWITDLKFVTTVANTAPIQRKKRKSPLTGSEKNHLSAMLDGVEDPDILARLEALGQGIIGKNRDES